MEDSAFIDAAPDGASVRNELKELIIVELNLAGKKASDIDDGAPLFGSSSEKGGLALDSLDALQLAMCVEEKFGVKVPEGEPARAIFASVNALTAHILRSRAT